MLRPLPMDAIAGLLRTGRKTTCLAIVAFAGLYAPAWAAETVTRIYPILPTACSFRIDGRLDEQGWSRIAETTDFTRVLTGSGPADPQTRVRIARTGAGLVIGFRCIEPEMKQMLAKLRQEDDFRESVEIFIDGRFDRRSFIQLRVSSGGLRDLKLGYDPLGDLSQTKWEAAVAYEKEAWTVEAAIPFSVIGVIPSDNARWGFNLNRQRLVAEPVQFSCWSNTEGGFQNAARFGQVIFRPFDVWLRVNGQEPLHLLSMRLEFLFREYPGSLARENRLREEMQRLAAGLRGETEGAIKNERDVINAMQRASIRQQAAEAALDKARLAVIVGEFR